MIACLFPDCEVVALGYNDEPVERQKRLIVDHINNDHVDAHVIMACAHDWRDPEPVTLTTTSGDTGERVDVQVVRERCARCLQYQQRDPDTADQPPKGDEGTE